MVVRKMVSLSICHLGMIFCVMDCLIFSVALLVVKRLTRFPVHCVVHLGEMRLSMLTINIQIDYRVIHSLVFISALLVMACMMMMPMVWVGVQTRRQEDASLEGGE